MVSEKWQHKQLGQLLKLRGGYAFKSEDFHEHGDVAVLRISNIKNNGIDLEDAVYVDRNVAEHAKDYKLREGNVVIAMSGATTGKTAIVRKEDLPLVLNQRVGVFDIYNSEHLSEEYLAYVVQSSSFKNQILVNAIGGAQPNISGKQIEDVEILLPPISEQRKIAAILSSVDEAIEKTEAIIEQTEKVKKGLMQQLLTKGIGHTKFKKTEIGEIPDSWNLVKLADVFEIVKRPVEMRDEEEYQLVTVKRRYGGVVPRERLKGKQIKVKSQFYLKHGDFLISKRQIVHGACEVVPKELEGSIVSNEYHTLLVKNGIDIDFIRWYVRLPMMQNYFLLSSVGVHIEKMLFKIEDWFKRIIALPPLEEQKQIANTLSSIEQSILKNQKYLEQLQTIKKALMQVLLTGKVRVKVDDEVMSQ